MTLRLEGHTDVVAGVAFSPDGGTALSGSSDGTARMWDTRTGRPVHVLSHADAVKAVGFTLDAQSVLTFSDDKTVHFWNAGRGRETDPRGVLGPRRPPRAGVLGRSYVLAAAFAPDGRHVLLGSQDKTTYLISLEQPEARARRFVGHTMPVFGVAFSNPGGPVLSHSQDGTVRVWDVADRSEVRRFEHRDVPLASVISPDGALVVTSLAGGPVDLWDVRSGKRLDRLPGLRRREAAHSLAFDADGRRVLAGLHRGALYLGDVARGVELCRLTGHADSAMAVAFSRDGKAALSGGFDRAVRLWRLPD